MAYKLSIDMKNSPEGAEVQIGGLGTFENGSTYDISAEEHENFRRYHGHVVSVVDEDTHEIIGSRFELGSDLSEALIHGVTFEEKNETAAEKKAREKQEAADIEAAKVAAEAEDQKGEEL